jgi:hypothetical protein
VLLEWTSHLLLTFSEMKKNRRHFDIYSAALPLFYVLKILGFAPFVLKGRVRKRRLKCSVISTFYSLSTFIIFTCFRYVALHSLVQEKTRAELLNTVVIFGNVCHLILNIFLAFLGVMNSYNVATILNRLSEFDSVSEECLIFTSDLFVISV